MARRSKALISVDEMKKQLATRASDEEAIVGEGGANNFISTKGGNFTYKNERLEDPLEVIVLAYAQDFAYYDSRFDPDNPSSPACFAVAACKAKDLAPSEEAPKPQADWCAECPMNEFGSAGKAKACKNSYRLAVVSAEDPEGDMAMIRIAPTGYRAWENYVNKLRRGYNTLPIGVYTSLTFAEEDYPVVQAVLNEEIGDPDVLSAVMGREEEATELVTTHFYNPEQYEEAPEPAPRRRRGKKKTRRRTE